MSQEPPRIEQPDQPEEVHISVSSMVASKTGKPTVQLVLHNEITQMGVNNAIALAHRLVEAASAAMADAFLITFLGERVQLSREQAGEVLVDFRDYRAKLDPASKWQDEP
jgi:hypothetical protein